CVRNSLDTLLESYNICHICGKGNSSTIEKSGYCQFEYVNEELPHLFALANLVISRSGATTLFEILCLHKPSLLIPLETNASRGDQLLNAASFEKQGFCKVLFQRNLTPETLIDNVNSTFSQKETIISAMKKDTGSGASKVMEIIMETTKES
ncbi:MAG: glycosyltransferase, partial [Fibrobacter sp.]|nr:glycosyltransferase [Fibrobacter sp.]